MPSPIGPLSDARTRRALRHAAIVLAAFTAATLAFTYPLIAHITTALPRDLGDPLLNCWILAWDISRLPHGLVGVWTAPNFFPYPDTLAYSEHLLGVAVLVAPIQWIGRNPVLTYNVAFVFSFVLAGSGMYLLCYSLTGSRVAAAVAGAAFAFCPYRPDQYSHIQMLTSGWMPVALWGLHRYLVDGRRSRLAVFAVAFLLQALSNGYSLYFFSAAVTVVMAVALVVSPRARAFRTLRDLAAAGLVIGAVMAPVALHYVDVKRSIGLVRSTAEMQTYSADLASYVEVNPTMRLWGGVLHAPRAEGQLFAGATVLALAAIALVTIGRRGAAAGAWPFSAITAAYALVAVTGVMLSLGLVPRSSGAHRLWLIDGIYRWLLNVLPGLDGLRVPARFGMIVFLALAVLAAVAVARLLARWPFIAQGVAGGLLVCAIVAEGWPGPIPYGRIAPILAIDSDAYAWLRAKPPGALLELPVDGEEPLHSLSYQYRTLGHGHPIVNGFSGYLSPLFTLLSDPASVFMDPATARDALRGFRAMGVRYVLLHRIEYPNLDRGVATEAALRAQTDQIADLQQFGWTTAMELRPMEWPTPDRSLARVPSDALRVAASGEPDHVARLLDGNIGTRWTSGGSQRGDEWVTIEFDRVRRVGGLEFDTSIASVNDFPRRLRVEGSADGQRFDAVLFEDAFMPAALASFARGVMPLPVEVAFRPAAVKALRLRQLGHTDPWYWSIDELHVWEVPAAK